MTSKAEEAALTQAVERAELHDGSTHIQVARKKARTDARSFCQPCFFWFSFPGFVARIHVVNSATLPLILLEDDHLLAIHKPSGINTHKPDRYAQDGIHEWLQKQRAEWRTLAILQRLDKETSGVMVFGKTTLANKSLTEQFERGQVTKTYLFLTSSQPNSSTATIATPIDGKPARTRFRVVGKRGAFTCVEAQPETGRTHQVRIHAAEAGFPVGGDKQYGPASVPTPRLLLHAARLELRHPLSGAPLRIETPQPVWFLQWNGRSTVKTTLPITERGGRERAAMECAQEFRRLLFDGEVTDSYRLISSAGDGFPGLVVDRFGGALLVQRFETNTVVPMEIEAMADRYAIYSQDMAGFARSKPALWKGDSIDSLRATEHGLRFVIRMDQGFSPGIFLDQRENRRRLRSIAAGRSVLNCFAYTCAFSVAAAAGGGKTTSVDLSKAYLDWGRENFRANHLNPDQHDFIYGDVFDWLKRFARRGRQWDIVLLDPPTFGTTKKGKTFRAAKDYFELVQLAVKLVRQGGTLFGSTNLRSSSAEQFVTGIERAVRDEKRSIVSTAFETQPFDFRVAEGEKPYLKTFWLTLD